ncbi:DUF1826 domain-containing protein [Sphingomonas sp.]
MHDENGAMTGVGNAGVILPDHVRSGPDRETLSAIMAHGVNLAIWENAARPDLPGDLASLDDIETVIALDRAEPELRDALIKAGHPPEAVGEWTAMLSDYARLLGELAGCARVSVRLEVIDSDACRKFHGDYVTLRLIATLAGPGTQWLDNGDAARLRAGADLGTLRVRDVTTGHVALFKGREWAPDTPIVHRSPPVAGSGQQRLVLVIDPVVDKPAMESGLR